MRERAYYMLAITVLLVAIISLVVVLGQNQPITSQSESTAGTSLQSLFTQLAQRVNSDSSFSFRIRVAALDNGTAITVSQADARVAEVGADYFCLSNANPGRVCYPFEQLLAVQVPD
jgi:hypothetical protein